MRQSRGRCRWAVVAACAFLLALAGCESGSDDGGNAGAAVKGPLRIATSWEITTLDPLTEGYWAPEFGYGELLLRPTNTGDTEPWIADSIESVSPNEWKITLKDGVTFQNGKPCDARAVAALINHQLAENPLLKPILGGAVAKATGDTTVTLTTKAPVSYVPNLFAQEDMFPVFDLKAYKAAGDEVPALIDARIYTGAYTVSELNSQHLVLKRNPNYWQGKPALPGVEVKFIPDHQARVLAVQSGEADFALYPPTEAAGGVESSGTAHFVTTEVGTAGPRTIFNLGKPPIDDVRVRQALSAAIDYEAIANDVMGGHYSVAEGMYPMNLPFAVANQKYDPDKARTLLDQAGWTESETGVRSKNGQPLELTLVTYRTDPDLQPMAVAMRSQLQQVGVDLKIREIESSSVIYDTKFTDWHGALILSAYFGISGNVIAIVRDYLTSDGPYNPGGISDPEIDALADELSTTFDTDRQHDLLRRVQDIMIADKAYTIVPAEKKIAVIVSDAWESYKPNVNLLWVDWKTAP